MMASKVPSEASEQELNDGSAASLRRAAIAAVLTGAGGSLGLMLQAGRRNPSRLLLVLMATWVLSPFVALLIASVVSKRWAAHTLATLNRLMLFVPLISLAVYGYFAWKPPSAQPASVYVVVPPVSWLFISIPLLIAALRARRTSKRG